MNDQQIKRIKTSDLLFDAENPRFYRLNAPPPSVVEEMIDSEGVPDLMLSIGQKGYFEGEPLLIIPASEKEKFIVVEGNRRLAAVKLLNKEILPPTRRQKSINSIIAEAAHAADITELPCIVYESRRDILRYLGYRHITGIQEWDSLSKARYLAQLRDEFYTEIPAEQQFRALAKDIGSRSDYVAQLLTALNLYDIAADNFLSDLGLTSKDINFSYITTALGYSKICSWLGLTDKKDTNMESLDTQNLRDIFAWMFVKNRQGYTIVGESRRISELAEVVDKEFAVQKLKESEDLTEAYIYTDGPDIAFGKVLEEALDRLKAAWNMLPKTLVTEKNHSVAEEVYDMSREIKNNIKSKLDDKR